MATMDTSTVWAVEKDCRVLRLQGTGDPWGIQGEGAGRSKGAGIPERGNTCKELEAGAAPCVREVLVASPGGTQRDKVEGVRHGGVEGQVGKVAVGSCCPELIHVVDNLCICRVVHFEFRALCTLNQTPFGQNWGAHPYILA